MRLCHLATAIIFSLPLTFADEIIESLLDQPADGQGSSGSNQTLQPVESLSTPAPVPAATAVPSQQQDETTSAGAGNCDQHADSHSKHKFNPFIHKPVYNVQVHATRGLDEAYDDVYKVFGEYLTMTAGQMFDPPISFQVVPQYFDGLFDAIKNEEMDFLYANPGVYSCVGVEAGATSLVTVVKDLDVRGENFELDVYGGVIATRHDNRDINTIHDLKDKIIAAGAIVDLMGGQMQIFEMERKGMSFFNDPKQVVFTKDQRDVVLGILDGKYDVGFVRTDQIEITRDNEGNIVDPDMFKVIEPKIFVMDNGKLFPFLHSTDILPEWPLAALKSVPGDVQSEVQQALLAFEAHAMKGQYMDQCDGHVANNQTLDCSDYVNGSFEGMRCDTTDEMARLTWEGSQDSLIAAFRPSRSYFDLRTMQQKAGFMVQDDLENWYCTRPSSLYDAITCPKGYFRRSHDEFLNGCGRIGLQCDEKDYDCFCKPCVRAFEVDVYPYEEGKEDLHLIEHYGDELPGCAKMEICATLRQGETVVLHIYDNEERANPVVRVTAHSSDSAEDLPVHRIEGTYAYEISYGSKQVQVPVLEILFDGEPITQSPIRLMVEEADCAAMYGEGSNREADGEGNCVCSGNTNEMGGICMESQFFYLIIFACVAIAMTVLVTIYLGYKKKQNDMVWHINPEELHFSEPPEIIGQGGFGVVVLGQYRGTKVAVKRVLPPQRVKASSKSLTSGSFQQSGSGSVDLLSETSMSQEARKPKKKGNGKTVDPKEDDEDKDKTVKFSKDSIDIETGKKASTQLKSGSSSTDWSKLLNMHHNDNVLKILESATASNHGSSSWEVSLSSHQGIISRNIPLWMKFDEHSRLKKDFINEMRLLSRLRHPCITTVMGAVISVQADPMLIMEFMEYGSLYDLLHNETMSAGGEILLQIMRDIVQGIQFLHASKPPILHGDLKAKNILVDSRFRAKVADFGFSHFKSTGKHKNNVLQGTPYFMAPEYLRRKSDYTAACDIYAIGMIFYEMYARQDPFEGEDPRKVLPKVCHPRINKRPPIPESQPAKITEVMKKCWSANPFFRPSAKDLDYILVEIQPTDAEPLVSGQDAFKGNMKRKTTSLYDVFPKHIADALNAGKKVEAESHEIVTVVFSDIVGFTTISQTFSPMKVSNMLDRLYQAFDELAGKHHVFKVETIGDAYMGVTNLDGSEFDTHVKQIAMFAQDAVAAASKILIDDEDPAKGYVQIRVGFHSGPVVSNVIGSLNPRYGLFGDTVNTASRMESNSVAGKIHCTYQSAQLLQQQAPEIPIHVRGMIKVKGKGKMRTFWVSEKPLEDDRMNAMQSFSENDHGDGGDDDDDEQSAVELDVGDVEHHSDHTGDTVDLSIHDGNSEDDHKEPSERMTCPRSPPARVGMDGTMV